MTSTTLRPLGVDTTRRHDAGAAKAKDSRVAGSTPPAVTPSGRPGSVEDWHGTSVGYRCRRCRCDLCRAEHRAWHKAYRARLRDAGPLTVDPLYARRRLEALMRIGWPLYVVAEHAGRAEAAIRELLNARVDRISLNTDQAVRDVYQKLHMTPGPSEYSRLRSAARGFYAPLAWDDIDDPNEVPDLHHVDADALVDGELIDPVVIERILGGDVVAATKAERIEVTRRWLALGRPWRHLEDLTRWNVWRYVPLARADTPQAPQAGQDAA